MSFGHRCVLHDDNDVPAPPDVTVPPGERPGGGRPHAAANEVRVREDFGKPDTVSGQKIGMPFGDVALSLGGQFDLGVQPWARQAAG